MKKEKAPTVRIRFSTTPRGQEMIEEIMERQGFINESMVLQHAIVMLHAKTFPAYAPAPGTPAASYRREPATAEERLQRAKEDQEAKAEFARQEYVNIVDELGGTVENVSGNEVAVYYNYSGTKRYPQRVPLRMVSRDLLANQYFPSRAKVEQLQRDGKVDYPIDVL